MLLVLLPQFCGIYLQKTNTWSLRLCKIQRGKEESSKTNLHCWLVGWFGLNGPFRQYFSVYRAISQREGERGEKRQKRSKNDQTTSTRTYRKRVGLVGWLFGFNGPLREYFSLYRAVSQREENRVGWLVVVWV